MKIVVQLKWVERTNTWHMLTPDKKASFIYDLFNCENMQRLFDQPDKDKEELFVLDVHRLSSLPGKEYPDVV